MSNLPRSREEAKQLGVTRYFTEEPCSKGHLSERYTSSAACLTCLTAHNKRSRHRQAADKASTDKRRLFDAGEIKFKGRFTSRYEIDDYLHGETVECLICGEFYAKLGRHVIMTHGVPPKEYKERFGIPQHRGLTSTFLLARVATSMAKNIAETGRKVNGRQARNFPESVWAECARRIEAGEVMKNIFSQPGMPSKTSWKLYLNRNPDLARRISGTLQGFSRQGILISPARIDGTLNRIRTGEPAYAPGSAFRMAGTTLLSLRRRDSDFASRYREALQAGRAIRYRAGSRSGHRGLPDFQLVSGLRQVELYAAIDAVIPKHFPAFIRDEIRSEMILSVLEGEFDLMDAKHEVRGFIADYFNSYASKWGPASLDAALYKDGTATLADRIAG